MTTTLACGFELKCSIIRSKSSDLALRDTFSDTAIQIPRFAAIEINDEIPCVVNENKENYLDCHGDIFNWIVKLYMGRKGQIFVKYLEYFKIECLGRIESESKVNSLVYNKLTLSPTDER